MRTGISRKRNIAILMGGLMLVGAGATHLEANDPKTVRPDEVRTWVLSIDGKDYEAHPATPAYDGSTGLFHLPSAYTLPKGRVSISLFRDNLDRDPKDEDISIHGVTLAFGATSRLELAASFGLQNRVDADALSQPGYVNDYPFVSTGWQTGAGDLKLGAKFKLLDDYGTGPVGLALRGYLKVPTANEEKGLGTGKRSTGVDLVMSKSLNRKADLHASLGYQWNGDPESPQAVDIGDALKWGVGINVPACRTIQVQAELTGTKYRNASFAQTDPLDLVVGPVIWFAKGLFIRPAISKNLKYDDRGLNQGGRSSTGIQFSMGYHPGTACCEIVVPPPPPPPPPPPAPMPVNRDPTVTCSADKASISLGENVGLRATAADPDGDNLTYVWSSNLGKVTGVGPSVQLETPGVSAPASLSATVRVSDGRGGEAVATCDVRIEAPEKSPETITCDSGGFSRNGVRLNNVDKACLDDVALRLRQDPRSRVVIIGHTDTSERRPDLLSRQRAESTRTYLTRERGIEDSRISTRGAGSAKSATAPMPANNRLVEVIFVPEGATAPSDK